MTPTTPAGLASSPTIITAAVRERGLSIAVGIVFCLSGVPALIDQVAGQRILALHSGVGAFSVAVIVAAYMAGLGLGSLAGGRLSRRLGRGGALRAFALVELGIGLFAAFSARLYYEMPLIPSAWFRGTGWRVGLVHWLVLLPPTSLMGMTFPLLSRAMVRDVPGAAAVIGRLYGLNILGAALGALVAPWVLIPALGLTGAIGFGAVCNLVVGLGGLLAGAVLPASGGVPEGAGGPGPDAATGPPRPFVLWVALYAFGGFLAVALEVLWFRLIDVGAKGTAYTFGTVLSLYLLGLAGGTLLGARRARRWADPLSAFLTLQCSILLASGASILLIASAPPDGPVIGGWFQYWGGYEPYSPRHGDWWSTFRLYAMFPLALHGIPTVLMGLSFGALQQGVQDDPRTSGLKVGLLQAANIAGCALGSLLVGLRWFVNPGTAGTFRGLVASGASFALVGLAFTRARRRFLAMGALLLLLATWLPDQEGLWRRIHGVRGQELLFEEDASGVVALLPEGGRWRISTNGKGQSHLPYGGIHSKLGALPATLHPSPGRIAIIGLGSGDTAWASACRPETRSVTVFETCPSQRVLLERLAGREDPWGLRALLVDRRVAVVEADGRHALAGDDEGYDLIEADAIRPNGAYSGNLYSVEFFELCRRKLRGGGFMCTWSPTPRTTATFRQVFPHVLELDNGVILLGSNEPPALDPDGWRSRLLDPAVSAYLGDEVLRECLAAIPTARPLAGPASVDPDRINTDLFPRDEYERPLEIP